MSNKKDDRATVKAARINYWGRIIAAIIALIGLFGIYVIKKIEPSSILKEENNSISNRNDQDNKSLEEKNIHKKDDQNYVIGEVTVIYDDTNQPVQNAEIIMNNNIIGYTNKLGKLSFKKKHSLGIDNFDMPEITILKGKEINENFYINLFESQIFKVKPSVNE